jgi:HK97 family phage prohead protease
MPYSITRTDACPEDRPFGVVKDSDGTVIGCHRTEDSAASQVKALYAAEADAAEGRDKYGHIEFKPPSGVKQEAAKGLSWRREFGRGGTEVGIARARDLSNGVNISPDTARRMKAYFDRHQSDKEGEGWSPGQPGFPSNGRIAWALWGGDAGWSWASKLVRQMEAADEQSRSVLMSNIEYRSIGIDTGAEDCLRVETRSEVVEANGEKREQTRDWIVGYAAMFGVDSLDLGDFIERIDPGAFSIVKERRGRKRPLETRALFNHDPNHVLGRFPETLRMTVDERGLRYEILPPASRPDIIESIRRGDIRGSSFSFTVAPGGERWADEGGRSIRTITAIDSLFDVGPVTFPAYPETHAAVAKRSYDLFRRSKAEASQRQASFAAIEKRLASKRAELERFLRERGR